MKLRIFRRCAITVFVFCCLISAQTAGGRAQASLLWHWSYSAGGIHAEGTFTTTKLPDGNGFYQIVGITGTRNGVKITGLQPTGTAIPGNQPYAVDNLVSAAGPQLTVNGFGFSLANGDYSNPFYNASSYYEYLSVPPYVNGQGPEVAVSFEAAAAVPPSGSLCNGMYDGTFNGNVTVSAGQDCRFINGGQITGNVTVVGGSFVANGAAVGGNLTVEGGGTFTLGPAATIGGNLKIDDLPPGSASNLVCGTTVFGNLTFDSNAAATQIGSAYPLTCAGNNIGGNASVNNNTGSLDVVGNRVSGNLVCRNNSNLMMGGGNTVGGTKTGQCY